MAVVLETEAVVMLPVDMTLMLAEAMRAVVAVEVLVALAAAVAVAVEV